MPSVKVLKNYAPCGGCGEEVDRDLMFAMNVKFYAPGDGKLDVQIPVRLCNSCADARKVALEEMRWDNSKMRSVVS